MNKQRRKQIADLKIRLEILKDFFNQCELHACIRILEDIKNDEEEAFYNMPEGLQCSERGMASEFAIGNLEEAAEILGEILELESEDEIESNIDAAIECMDNATT